eukprot:3967665-Alexandrium_andersonii.AAC.1
MSQGGPGGLQRHLQGGFQLAAYRLVDVPAVRLARLVTCRTPPWRGGSTEIRRQPFGRQPTQATARKARP